MIHVQDITKHFRFYAKPSDRLRELITRRPRHHSHKALDGISFQVASGETLGILGRNGAGKSTLLKILTGVLLPDSGTFRIEGRITGLLELGTGFDSNLTGAQNILANGLLLGMTRQEVEARRQAIIDFSELGTFIDEPLRTYSSGMVMRLAFAIGIHADPSCFVIDEALSVGDAHFQQKCMRRIREFRAQGGSIIFVSHDINAVKMLCDKVVVLEGGKAVFAGEPEAGANHYNRLLAEETDLDGQAVQQANYGSGEVTVLACNLAGQDSGGAILTSGERAELLIDLEAREDLNEITLGLMIRDRFGQDVFGTNTFYMGQKLAMRAAERQRCRMEIDMWLAPGKYTLTLALHEGSDHTRRCYQWCDNLLRFDIAGIRGPTFGGICRLPMTCHFGEPGQRSAKESDHAASK
ncbi:MAG: ABC transporter ATP-binding protein [Halomonas sp.]|uniref:ABC transporter ATP-binding protein n=1 Tax=Halomonas sp. TaxID=1486246 RepID=UPI0028709A31|nr:ABC transporter ATP-binding protein [Halomonas sp.]MDR9440917.1 ABC transporter ATP-binding protein [Halomonas sp.]